MKLILIRHGETGINVKKLTHKTGDEAVLTLKGKKQMLDNLKLLQSNKVGKIFCSPEARAVESAEILGERLDLEPIVLEELGERNWGRWEGKPWEWIKGKLDKMSLEERYTFIPPNGELWKQMEERLKLALGKIIDLKSVAVVTHGGAMRGLMPILKNLPKEASFRYDFKNGEAVVLNVGTDL